MKSTIHIKRIYEDPSPADGFRVLVDRLWPRGISKEKAQLDHWEKEIAPSDELRKWFGHDVARWSEFQKKYTEELNKNPAVAPFIDLLKSQQHITFLYGAKDEEHNQAVVLKQFISKKKK